jgi:hypothetical protein
MNPRDWHAAEWGAFGQVGALVVAGVAGVLVWRQVRHAAKQREDQTRPYVIVDFEFQGWEVLIAMRNLGSSPAMNVEVSFDSPLQTPRSEDLKDMTVFSEGVPMLAPGRVIAIPFGHGPDFFEDGAAERFPMKYRATVEYSTHGTRRRYKDAELVLDLAPYRHTLIERDDLHQIHQHLNDIKRLMKAWTSGQRLRVNVMTQAEQDEHYRTRRERRRLAGQPEPTLLQRIYARMAGVA